MKDLYNERLATLFKKKLSLTPSMVEKLLIFLAGLMAQEETSNQETQQQK